MSSTVETKCDGCCATGNAVKGNLRESNGLVNYLNNLMKLKDDWVLVKLTDDEDKWYYVIEFNVKKPFLGKTEIREYISKKTQKVSLAHFNGNTYMGSVVKKGKTPIDCQKWEVPNKENWFIRDGVFVRR